MSATAEEAEFAARTEPHRRELHVHCYRMLGSFDQAEDLVQETLLRAWRARDSFQGGDLFRAWLYRIATNACLDELKRSSRQAPAMQSIKDVPWLQPYPDALLDEVAPRGDEPEAAVVAEESTRLAFIAVIQALPPRQRAVLVLRDVLDWSAAETAEALDLSVAAANSALQRGRATLREHLPEAEPAGDDLSADEARLLEVFIDTHQRGDTAGAIAVMREDIRVTMPPNPFLYDGREQVSALITSAFEGERNVGDWRLVATRANRMPTAASYLRQWGDTEFRAFKFDVIRVGDGRIAEITTFGADLFPQFGLPEVWTPGMV